MLGEILKEARKARKLTLAEAAAQIGVSVGYLSNLEKNRQEPSLNILQEIASKLDISLAMLLEEEEDLEEAVVIRKKERTIVKFRNLPNPCEILTPFEWRNRWPAEMQVLHLEVPGGSPVGLEELSTEEDECLYVETGRLVYGYGEHSQTIEAGGSIYIPRRTGYSLFNPDQESAFVYWMIKMHREV